VNETSKRFFVERLRSLEMPTLAHARFEVAEVEGRDGHQGPI
jgi:hypothetical protein